MKETKRQAVSPGCPRSVFWRTQRVNKRSQPAIIRSGRKACLRVRRRLKAEQCYKMGVSAKVSRGGRNSHPREESAWVWGLVEVLVVAQSDPTHSEWRRGYGKNRAEIGVCVCALTLMGDWGRWCETRSDLWFRKATWMYVGVEGDQGPSCWRQIDKSVAKSRWGNEETQKPEVRKW